MIDARPGSRGPSPALRHHGRRGAGARGATRVGREAQHRPADRYRRAQPGMRSSHATSMDSAICRTARRMSPMVVHVMATARRLPARALAASRHIRDETLQWRRPDGGARRRSSLRGEREVGRCGEIQKRNRWVICKSGAWRTGSDQEGDGESISQQVAPRVRALCTTEPGSSMSQLAEEG